MTESDLLKLKEIADKKSQDVRDFEKEHEKIFKRWKELLKDEMWSKHGFIQAKIYSENPHLNIT